MTTVDLSARLDPVLGIAGKHAGEVDAEGRFPDEAVVALRDSGLLGSRETFATKAAARARVPAWIDNYNRHRRHSACGMRSPVDYELTQARRQAA